MARAPKVDYTTLDEQFAEAINPSAGFSDQAVQEFRQFVREGKFQVDNRDVDADAFFWLDPLYDIKRSDILGIPDGDGGWTKRPDPQFAEGIMLRKSSQGGATVFSILLLVWLCIDLRRGLNVGCFWPNEDDVIDFVQMRFVPLLESSEKIQHYIKPSNVNNTRSKQIGISNLWFRYVNGSSKTDSVPLDIIVGDEVRLWGEPERVKGLMQRMEERFGQSEVRLKIWMSTVGSPGDAMETLWQDSNQIKYVTTCPNGCVTEVREKPEDPADRLVPVDERHSIREGAFVLEGVVLSDWNPTVITTMVAAREAEWCCPCCGAVIPDTRVGPGFAATFPNSPGMFGLEFARTLYRTITPFKLRREHDTATDKKQFWNGWMAKPYRDPKGTLVKDEHIRAARADERVKWWSNKPPGMSVYLGADVRTEELHYVLLGVAPEDADNTLKGQILSLGVLQGEDGFERLEKMLFDYVVDCAIIDYKPQTTHTLPLARRNSHRVFLADYRAGEMIRKKASGGKNTNHVEDDVKETNIVLIDRTLSIKYSLNTFAMGNWKMPAEALEQANFIDRKRQMHSVYDVAWEFTDHLQNIALTQIDKTAKNASKEAVSVAASFDERFDNVRYDPHFVHALNYAVMASQMQPAGVQMITSARTAATPTNPLGLKMPEPVHVNSPRCGTCQWWEGEDKGDSLGRCERLGFRCTAMQPPCPYKLYRKKKN